MLRMAKRLIILILFLSYFIAILFNSDLWGNLLSPIVTFITFYIVFRSMYYDLKPRRTHLSGLFLSISILVWALTDALWAVLDLGFHINPEEVAIVTFGYSLTNLFLVISLTVYGLHQIRKWNIVQILLDTIIMIFFVFELIWIFFLNRNVDNLIRLQNDILSDLSIGLDIMILIWVTIWFMSIRNGKISLFLKFNAAGVLLFAITDLVYYYQYFFSFYDPNTIIDAVYVFSFGMIAIAGYLRSDNQVEVVEQTFNIGRKRKGYVLLIAPISILLFKGFMVIHLFHFVVAILVYNMLSNYIQFNIQKDSLFQREKELNNELEQKVKTRTEELIEKNLVLEELINLDFVTGLKNRRYLLAFLEEAIDTIKDTETILLLYIDINRFKMISTMFGHYIGETVLSEMAERLKPLEKEMPNSILASYREDMFIFAAKGKYDYPHGYMYAEKAIRLGSNIYKIEDYQIRITANIGISIFPYDATTKEELIKHADIAMSHARSIGFNTIKEFDRKLSDTFFRRNSIEIMLKRVNFHQEFMIYYQPQLTTADRKLKGFEALIRWKTQKGEFIPPNEFIPIAEETGYIVPIGDWVMRMALKQLASWNKNADDKIMIGLNVSLKQLNTIQFTESLYEEISRLSLKPEWIDVEITESLQLQDNPEIFTVLEEMRSRGISISIDDFGTGFSSLSYLKDLPADRIKIARELVNSVHIDNFDYQLVKSIILISRSKGIKVIAEGVETEEQWAVLKELQCDEIQGYLFGKPMPVPEVEAIYRDRFRLGLELGYD